MSNFLSSSSFGILPSTVTKCQKINNQKLYVISVLLKAELSPLTTWLVVSCAWSPLHRERACWRLFGARLIDRKKPIITYFGVVIIIIILIHIIINVISGSSNSSGSISDSSSSSSSCAVVGFVVVVVVVVMVMMMMMMVVVVMIMMMMMVMIDDGDDDYDDYVDNGDIDAEADDDDPAYVKLNSVYQM